jgi:PAS domain S-box-containing protein
MAVLTAAALKGWIPAFFVQGVGPTLLRQQILGGADILFVFSCVAFMATYVRNQEAFLYWYACALALTAISLTAFLIQNSVGSPVGWVGRTSQYVGGVYFLVSLLAAQSRGTSLDSALAASLSKAEARIRDQHAILAGINRILHEALTCETEEKLGRVCLAVAEELTQSKFGFIGEINARTGRLDDIAISDPGWEACRMTDPVGHGKTFPGGFEIEGIYDRVIQDAKGFFTNDPASHPDCIGVPALTAFLGVPLIHAGKVIGMVGLANRDGGYGHTQLAAAEALAPAIVEAIMRIRAEGRLSGSLDAMTRLQKIGTFFVREGNLEGALGEIVEAAIAISKADFGSIQLLVPGTSTLRIAAQRGFPQWWVDFWDQVVAGQGACGTALKRGERVIVEDVEQSPVFAGTPSLEIQLRAGVRAVQSTPLFSRSGKLLGMFSTHYKRPHRPDERTLKLLNLLARQVADIIERAQIEEALRQSEERLRLAQEGAHVGIWDRDIQSGRLSWTPELERMHGYAEGTFPGTFQAFRECVHPDDLERMDHERDEAIRAHKPFDLEFRVRHLSGDIRWFITKGSAIYDQAGNPQRVLGINEDITERKETEARLEADLTALNRIHQLSGRMLGDAGLEPILQDIMDAAVSVAGAQRGTLQLLENDSLRIVAHHGHQQPFLDFFAAAENRASVSGEATKRGQRVVVPDVEASPLFAGTPSLAVLRQAGVRAIQSTPLLSRNGALLGILTTQWDRPYSPNQHDLWRIDLLVRQAADLIEGSRAREALRESEMKYRQLFQNMTEEVQIWGLVRDEQRQIKTWRLIDINPPTLKTWGRTSIEDTVGKLADEIYPGTTARYMPVVQKIMTEGVPHTFEDYYPPPVDMYFRFTCIPLGERFITTGADITALKKGQLELERLVAERTAKLQEMVGELEHFSYTITHDMRAPLRAMAGFGELLSDLCADCKHQDRREFIKPIVTSAMRMDRLIMDALNYSRAVRGELPLERVDTAALLRGMLDSYPEMQPARACIQIEGRLPVVLANEAGLTQCFSNLINNAVKFVKPGEKPRIRIRAEEREGRARIWVEDNGIGISRNMLPRVFDMFSRGHNEYEGTGIGLALVRKVAQRMGGKAGVESEEGKGSCFWLELSVASPAAA